MFTLRFHNVWSWTFGLTSWTPIGQRVYEPRRRLTAQFVIVVLQLAGDDNVNEAETRLALLKRSALKKVQAQSRTSSLCTPQSGNRTLTPSQLSASTSGGRSKRDEFLEVSLTRITPDLVKCGGGNVFFILFYF